MCLSAKPQQWSVSYEIAQNPEQGGRCLLGTRVSTALLWLFPFCVNCVSWERHWERFQRSLSGQELGSCSLCLSITASAPVCCEIEGDFQLGAFLFGQALVFLMNVNKISVPKSRNIKALSPCFENYCSEKPTLQHFFCLRKNSKIYQISGTVIRYREILCWFD